MRLHIGCRACGGTHKNTTRCVSLCWGVDELSKGLLEGLGGKLFKGGLCRGLYRALCRGLL